MIPILFPDYQEVCAALTRVQKALGASGESALAARVAGAAGALLCPALRTALATRSAVLTAVRHKRSGLAPPHTHRATDRLKDVSGTGLKTFFLLSFKPFGDKTGECRIFTSLKPPR